MQTTQKFARLPQGLTEPLGDEPIATSRRSGTIPIEVCRTFALYFRPLAGLPAMMRQRDVCGTGHGAQLTRLFLRSPCVHDSAIRYRRTVWTATRLRFCGGSRESSKSVDHSLTGENAF